MATVIIRPNGVEAVSGFDQTGTGLYERLSDEDDSTSTTQNQSSAEIRVTLETDSVYAGATINSIELIIIASSSGRGAAGITYSILNSSQTVLASDTDTFTTENATQIQGLTYSTSLTPTIVDGLQILIEPDSNGCKIHEAYIEVDYDPAMVLNGSVELKSGKFKIVSGKIKI
jgi:hypothetical protein